MEFDLNNEGEIGECGLSAGDQGARWADGVEVQSRADSPGGGDVWSQMRAPEAFLVAGPAEPGWSLTPFPLIHGPQTSLPPVPSPIPHCPPLGLPPQGTQHRVPPLQGLEVLKLLTPDRGGWRFLGPQASSPLCSLSGR